MLSSLVVTIISPIIGCGFASLAALDVGKPKLTSNGRPFVGRPFLSLATSTAHRSANRPGSPNTISKPHESFGGRFENKFLMTVLSEESLRFFTDLHSFRSKILDFGEFVGIPISLAIGNLLT